jgi:hypothetical protein
MYGPKGTVRDTESLPLDFFLIFRASRNSRFPAFGQALHWLPRSVKNLFRLVQVRNLSDTLPGTTRAHFTALRSLCSACLEVKTEIEIERPEKVMATPVSISKHPSTRQSVRDELSSGTQASVAS